MTRSPPDPDDQALFRQLVADAQPLAQQKTEPYRRRRAPVPLPQPAYLRQDPLADGAVLENELETGDFLEFSRPGVQLRLLQELKRGELGVQFEVDLHGLTIAYAQELLDQFLTECSRRGVRTALVIHGKGRGSEEGQPVLKRKVNYWLRLRDEVLAFCSATRRHGGTGALYLLLRNPRKLRAR